MTIEDGRQLLRAVCGWWLQGANGAPAGLLPPGIGLTRHGEPLCTDPERDAVLAVHLLELRPGPALQLWSARWPGDALEPPAYRAAMCAARLLAVRERLQVLVAGCSANGRCRGALVDADTCARIAIAGLDVETEMQLGNSEVLLDVAGDLLALESARPAGDAGYLLLGLKG